VIRTALTELTGISCPVIQAGMGYVAGARLAAAASEAGALGTIAAATLTTGGLRTAIGKVRDRTSQPFAVNLRADAADAAEKVAVIIGTGVPVVTFAQAPRPELISRLRDAGVITIASAGTRRHAEKAAAWGADAVIAAGAEAGGHVGPVPTSLLVPQVAGAAGVPVIAAGGFFDGRGLAAALAWGAAGIAMGTRFLLTSDSPVADAVKREYLASDVAAGTVVTRRADGVPHRVLRTALVDRLESAGRLRLAGRSIRSASSFRRISGLSWPDLLRQGRMMRRGGQLSWAQVLMAASTPVLLRAAMVDGRADLGLMSAGQVAGLIDDLPSCADLMAAVMAEAEDCIARLGGLVQQAGGAPGG
jgi:NAD(P)H-dependent flavin oxidoreductase YrpB (nitropropane dioxygenase family)